MLRQQNLEEQLDRVRSVARGTVARRARELDEDARWPEEGMAELLEAGVAGLVVPESCGGAGHGLLAVARSGEILGRHCASTSICFGMHLVASAVIAAKATEDQQRLYLEPIARGEHLTTLALSEPGSGAHFYLPASILTQNDEKGGFLVDGEKSFVTNGGHADSYVVSTASTQSSDEADGEFSCVLVDADCPGLEWGSPWEGMGMRGNSSRSLRLRQVAIPSRHLLGEEGDQIWYVFEVVAPYFLMAMAGTYLGVATAAFEETREHLESRHYTSLGTAPAESSVIQHHLGRIWSRLEATRQLVHHAGRTGDIDPEAGLLPVLSAKAEVADAATQIVNECLTLLGGIGYGYRSTTARLLRDVRAAHVMAPTTDQLRTWTGRALLDRPLLSP